MAESNQGGDLSIYVNSSKEKMTAGNYNEADALVFAELAYGKFENCDFGGREEIGFREFVSALEARAESADDRAFLKSLLNSPRYKNCVIRNMEAENETSQWAAFTIDMRDGTDSSVIAMRGTDGTTLGWTEDFELLYNIDGTNAQNLSAEYLKNCNSGTIYLTGHSKGGNDVISAYIMNNSDVRDRVVRINNYDGPGVNMELKESYAEGYAELNDKLYNYYPKSSIIGKLLIDDPGESTYFECDQTGHTEILIFGDHDPYSFKLNENGSFQEAEQSVLSSFVNEVLDNTVAELSIEERQSVFEVLVAFGIPALIAKSKEGNPYSDNEHWWQNIMETIDIWQNLSDEQKDASGKMLGCLAGYAVEEIKEKVYETYEEVRDAVCTYVNEAWNYIGEKINNIKKTLSDKWNEIRSYVIDKVTEMYEGFTEFAENFKNWISGKKGNAASYANSSFSVRLTALDNCAEKCSRHAGKLRGYRDQIDQIQKELGMISTIAVLIPFASVKRNMNTVANSCDRFGSVLSKTASYYRKTENQIKAV